MNRFKQELLATDLAAWRKKVLFAVVIGLSAFSFLITYAAMEPDIKAGLLELRYFLAIAVVQSLAQISIAWYLMRTRVPNYVIISLVTMVILFQVTYGVSVILISNT